LNRVNRERKPGSPREQNSGSDGNKERKSENETVDVNLARARRESGRIVHQQIESGDCQTDSEQSTQHRQDKIFGKELPPQ
jgi:hypothetical protein